ncbi:YihY/virulence factor BrkB family protein [uncultured Sphingomonas sp.]|uniref:YihY/virulence factor BrkB family protein n=1 Tax=uncultured Sphingomonas sp. TaxID=158754 RepID=UPI0025F4D8A5|nr:YihY/virulence factor BrkB family protein [uncultured Sphingomonas sp.]
MQKVSPASPEQRAQRGNPEALDHIPRYRRGWEIVKRVGVGVYSDGFIHAGNLAYLALISLFPFFIVTAALAHALGRGPDTTLAVESFLRTLPRSVRELIRQPISDVLAQRTGSLLWLGGLVGLWTTGSFIETIRDILRRAYGVSYSKPFWHYRLMSVALVMGSVVLMLLAFSLQLLLTGVEQLVARLLPVSDEVLNWIGWSRLAPGLALFVSLYLVFYTLAPSKYRWARCPKWAGAAFTAVWWVVTTMGLPRVLAALGGYDRTYGSLAGVIIALFFFWLVGFGLVIGAHLNAALAETPQRSVRSGQSYAQQEE